MNVPVGAVQWAVNDVAPTTVGSLAVGAPGTVSTEVVFELALVPLAATALAL